MAKRNVTVAVKTVRGARIGNTVLATLDDVVTMARTVNVGNFADMIARSTANHGVLHAGRHVARFTGHRVMQTQNDTLTRNAEWQLDDVQLLFVWRTLFPVSSGKLFAGTVPDGVAIVRGVRADYNRTGHGMPSGKPLVESVSYGAKRFTFPGAGDVATVPANVPMVEPAKRTVRIARKRAS